MTSRFYDGKDHIFFNENGNDVYIKPAEGQTLHIEGETDVDLSNSAQNQVLFNNEEQIYGNEALKFYGDTLYTVDVDTENVISTKTKEQEGINTLGTRTLLVSPSGVFYGKGVGIAKVSNNVYAFLHKKAIPPGTTADVRVFKNNVLLTSLPTQTSIFNQTLPAVPVSLATNEDATRIYFTDGSRNNDNTDNSRYSYYTRSGDTFTYQSLGRALLVSATQEYLTVSYYDTQYIAIRNMDLATIQVVKQGGAQLPIDHKMSNGNLMVLLMPDAIEIYKRTVQTWALAQTIPFTATVGSVAIYNNTLVATDSGTIYIYERPTSNDDFVLIKQFLSLGVYFVAVYNENIFAIRTTTTSCYSKYFGVWTSMTSTTPNGGTPAIPYSVAITDGYLMIGMPENDNAFGEASVFPVSPFVRELSKISMDSDTILDINAPTTVSLSTNALPRLEVSSSLIRSYHKLEVPYGSFPSPTLSFTGNTGFYAQNDIYGAEICTSLSGVGPYMRMSSDRNTIFRTIVMDGLPVNQFQVFARTGLAYGLIEWNGATVVFTSVSSRKVKKNIQRVDCDYYCSKLMELKPSKFNYISQSDTEKKTLGLIADEVKDIIPEAYMPEGILKGEDGKDQVIPERLDMSKIVPLLISSVQSVVKRLEAMEARLSSLEASQ